MFEFDESNELELKSTFKNDVIVKEIVSFLNANGGIIYVGVNDDKSICGINNIDESMRNLADITMTQIEPIPIDLIQGSIIFREGKSILKIEVLKGTHNLYCIKKYGYSQNGCIIRIGASCSKLPIEEINSRYKKRFASSTDYMLQIESGYGDISFNTLQISLINKGFHINSKSFEQNYHLRNDKNKFNQLAELLSDNNMIPMIFVKFKGENKSFVSERTDYGRSSIITAFYNMRNRLLSENICMTDTTVRPRKDTYLYDFDAVNEALVNAFVHNDWNIAEPLVSFYSNRLEILSHGGLPYGQTEEQLFNGISVPRNRGLMRIFQDLEITEQTGHGTLKVISTYGTKAYDINENYINVIIPFNEKVMINHGNINDNINGNINSNLSDLQIKTLEILLLDPKITLDAMTDKLQVSKRTVSRIFKDLQEKYIIKRVGSNKTGYWKILK